eukprot:CAMPEP_0196245256 /NCGR_PEP_ID=MMETSP0913-20130531/32751_1 /TAXON_ID=49265 /ORGANISM="Thalassiosira rotula, Strain GSO102" /LENGTH=57 /DNA_ID=CAMNT_0041529451 /DNA_START=39 /DNA_END=209 /DNA_ORIENTATION=+
MPSVPLPSYVTFTNGIGWAYSCAERQGPLQMPPGDGTHRPLIVVFSSLVPQQQKTGS